MHLSPVRTGLVLGAVIGLWHAAWAVLVAGGVAQALIDFILRIHFLHVTAVVQPFDGETAALLVGITFGIGFIVGGVLALVWNALLPRVVRTPAN
jgi:hypothetical protein